MVNNELTHHGVKGQRWGVRRFQNKDGSLTTLGKKRKRSQNGDDKSSDNPVKRLLKKASDNRAKKQAEEAAKKRAEEEAKNPVEESVESRRARLLKSTDPDELYKNRNLLTTVEINERINRINTEKRLREVADETKESGMEFVDKWLKRGRKLNEVYEFTQTPVMKAVAKKLGIGGESKPRSLQDLFDNFDTLTDEEVSSAKSRAEAMSKLKTALGKHGTSTSDTKTKTESDTKTKTTSDTKTKSEPGSKKSMKDMFKKAPEMESEANAEFVPGSGKTKGAESTKSKTKKDVTWDTVGESIYEVGPYVSSVPSVYKTSGSSYVNSMSDRSVSSIPSTYKTLGSSAIAGLLEYEK